MKESSVAAFYVGASMFLDLDSVEVDAVLAEHNLSLQSDTITACRDCILFHHRRSYALAGLLTVADVAEQFGVGARRARALISSRHRKFGVGMKFGSSWLVHRDELPSLAPDERYRRS